MKRTWISTALRKQLKVCRAVAQEPEDLREIERFEEMLEESMEDAAAVNFATASAASEPEQEAGK